MNGQFVAAGFAKVCQEPGVKDIPVLKARAAFAKALIAEDAGEVVDAERLLNEACEFAAA